MTRSKLRDSARAGCSAVQARSLLQAVPLLAQGILEGPCVTVLLHGVGQSKGWLDALVGRWPGGPSFQIRSRQQVLPALDPGVLQGRRSKEPAAAKRRAGPSDKAHGCLGRAG